MLSAGEQVATASRDVTYYLPCCPGWLATVIAPGRVVVVVAPRPPPQASRPLGPAGQAPTAARPDCPFGHAQPGPRLLRPLWAAFGLLLAGAVGNLCDRLTRAPGIGRGAVVDFIDLQHFATFNIADCCLTCGAALAVLLSLRRIPLTGQSPDHAERLDMSRVNGRA
jgi:hypothetical protein